MIRYANDLVLTELGRQIVNEHQSLQAHLTAGYLDAAFISARLLEKKLEKLMDRLNDLKYSSNETQGPVCKPSWR